MKEFADRFEERPEDPLPKQSSTRKEERAVLQFDDHAPDHEPTPPTAFDTTLLSPYQRSLRRRRTADARIEGPPTGLTGPGLSKASFVTRRLQTQEEKEPLPDVQPAPHVKRTHDELYSASSDEDRPRHRKRFKQSLPPPPQEEQTPDVSCSASRGAFRTPPCFCGRKDPVYKSSTTQTDITQESAPQQPAIQSDQLMLCSFLEMTGRSLLMAFTELWYTDRNQYEAFFDQLTKCPAGDEDATPFILSLLQKYIPRRADRTAAMSLARFFGHYGKDGIDAVQDWMAKIGGSTFGSRVKAEPNPQKSQRIEQSGTSTQRSQERCQPSSRDSVHINASMISPDAAQIQARLAAICELSGVRSGRFKAVHSRQRALKVAFQATDADLDRIFNERIDKYRAAGQMIHAKDAERELRRRQRFLLQAIERAAENLDRFKKTTMSQFEQKLGTHRFAWPGPIIE